MYRACGTAHDGSINWVAELNDELMNNITYDSIDMVARLCGGLANQAGWNNQPLDVPKALMLTVSELAEAMEGHRKSLQDDHLPQHKMFDVELADAFIRICHLADRAGVDLGQVVLDKLIYNTTRADHKPEVRAAEGGKAY